MAHTLPDYSTKYKTLKVFGSIDNAELAARNTGLSMFDRRGNVVWWDNFESTNAVKWHLLADGAGTTALSTERAWMGDQSMKMTTDVNASDSCSMTKLFSVPFERHMGMEAMFHIKSGAPLIELNLEGYSGSKLHYCGIQFNYNLSKILYNSSFLTWTELTVYDGYDVDNYQWIPLKVVADWGTGKYVRVMFGGTEYNLSTKDLPSVANAGLQRICAYICAINQTDEASEVYVDNFIFTQNE